MRASKQISGPDLDTRERLRAVVTLSAVAVAGLAAAWLYLWGGDLHRFIQGISGYIAMFIAHFAIYLAACFAVFRRPGRSRRESTIAVALVLLFAALFRAELVGRQPYLSTDTYRYIWDGRVQTAGINPYRYVPSADELAHLREDRVYPKINRADFAQTPYPPVAQAIYYAIYRVYPLSITAFKIAMSLFDLLAILAVMLVLAREGIDPARAVIFAWHPLLIWEGAHSGHVESAFILFIALALLARVYRRYALTGVALGLAAMVKFYPALLLPVFMSSSAFNDRAEAPKSLAGWIRAAWSTLTSRNNLWVVGAFVTTIVVSYLPYLGAGKQVFGYLPNEFREEGYVDQGERYFLLLIIKQFVNLPTWVFMAGGAVGLACGGVWWLVRRKTSAIDVARGAVALIGLFWIVTTPRYSWYYAWILPFLCLVPATAWLYLTGATVLLYLLWFIPNVYPEMPVWLGASLYGPTLLFLLRESIKTRQAQREAQ
ncbi:MAG TPA: glycosyltransferase family 87 protein [Blastocatellia bacterium]|nr:glycosyltransferase family 87 protein [Blastocatellia bacterium]